MRLLETVSLKGTLGSVPPLYSKNTLQLKKGVPSKWLKAIELPRTFPIGSETNLKIVKLAKMSFIRRLI